MARSAVLLAIASLALLAVLAAAQQAQTAKKHDYYHKDNYHKDNYGPPQYGDYHESYDYGSYGGLPEHVQVVMTGVPDGGCCGGKVRAGDNSSAVLQDDDEEDEGPPPNDDSEDFDDGDDDADADPDTGDAAKGGSSYYYKNYKLYCQDPHALGAYGPYGSSYGGHNEAEPVNYVAKICLKFKKYYFSKFYKLWGVIAERVAKIKWISIQNTSWASESWCSKFFNEHTHIWPWHMKVYKLPVHPNYPPNMMYLDYGGRRRVSASASAEGPPATITSFLPNHQPEPDCTIAKVVKGNVMMCTQVHGKWAVYYGTMTAVVKVYGNGYGRVGAQADRSAGSGWEDILEEMCDEDVPEVTVWKWEYDLHLVDVHNVLHITSEWIYTKILSFIGK